MKVRAVVASVALGCAVAASPSVAGPARPADALVFSGAGPASATFTLDRTTRLDFRVATVTTSGSYGGVLIRRDGRPDGHHWGLLATGRESAPVPIVGASGERHVFAPSDPTRDRFLPLPPGRYRAYLLGEAPVEVRLPLREGRPQVVYAGTPAKPQQLHSEDHLLLPGPARLAVQRRFSRPADGFDLLLARFSPVYAEQPEFELAVHQAEPPRWGWTWQARVSTDITLVQDVGPDESYAGDWQAEVTLTTPLNTACQVTFMHFHADFG